jgi:hypothetical protein
MSVGFQGLEGLLKRLGKTVHRAPGEAVDVDVHEVASCSSAILPVGEEGDLVANAGAPHMGHPQTSLYGLGKR